MCVLVSGTPASATGGSVWTTLPSVPTARAFLGAATAPCPTGQTGNCVYAVGGWNGGNPLETVESYSPAADLWTTLAPLPQPRSGLAAASAPCPAGQVGTCVYAVGGMGVNGTVGAAIEAYNPATNAWSVGASMPTPRAFLAAAAGPCPARQPGVCVYAIGGQSSQLSTTSTVEVYNPATNAWSTAASTLTDTSSLSAAAAACPGGASGTCVYLVGVGATNPRVQLESYNPATDAWSARATPPVSGVNRAAVSSAPCPPGQPGTCVYQVGGENPDGTGAPASAAYNPATNAWTRLPVPTPLRIAPAGATAACPPGETGVCVYVVGGEDSGGTDFGPLEAFDPPAATP